MALNRIPGDDLEVLLGLIEADGPPPGAEPWTRAG
jgi:hypothetical protein